MPKFVPVAMTLAAAVWIAPPERAAASDAVRAIAFAHSGAMTTEVGAKRRAGQTRKHAHQRSTKRGRSARLTVYPAYRGGRYVTPLIHPYDLYVYRRPFFVPGPPPFVPGLRRDGMGTAAYGFGVQ
jgi:hypothetical protein